MLNDTLIQFMIEVRDTAKLAAEVMRTDPDSAETLMRAIVTVCNVYLGGQNESRDN